MTAPSPLHDQARARLRDALADPAADFRDGQWEAIQGLVERKGRLLVVQRTGWGKSVVYFLATRLLRDRGAGPTLLVSPLLALMRNQIDAAVRLGVRAETVNSTNRDDWAGVRERLRANEIDVLVISPERLANEDFLTNMLLPLAAKVGLFVVDEAHCISDWGHDFRPDYRRITRVLQRLPANVPICATTATANDRVVADVVSQLGSNLQVIRGALVRESLHLQTVPLADDAAKLAWLAEWLPKFKGSGIVYALTQRWTERVTDWLVSRGVPAICYHAGLENDERQAREELLLANKVKALVATTALGMGYDKPDLGFVVHFHQPASVVHYYQQVGRAGRAIPKAYGVMLSGGDDRDINDYFIEQAFPSEGEVRAILDALESAPDGLTTRELERRINLRWGRIENAVRCLAVEATPPVARAESRWARTDAPYDDAQRAAFVAHHTAIRRAEQEQMDRYRQHAGCFMEFLSKALDDPAAKPCGKCAACQGKPDAMRGVNEALVREAIVYLRRCDLPLELKAMLPSQALPQYGWSSLKKDWRGEVGRALCILGDSGWGAQVRREKEAGGFGDDLADALADLVRRWQPTPRPAWVTCVPSLARPPLVPDLAKRVADRLGLPFVAAVSQTRPTKPQADMDNGWHRANNRDGAFAVTPWEGLAGPVLLIDDVADSGWTLTVVAALLRQAGSGSVLPLALAAARA